ncbi:MAG: hypothetical protein R3C11_23780 [Planctomycetaceae bacterium]
MPLSVQCSSCSKSYKVKDEFAGRSFKCKECGSVVSVPGGTQKAKAGASPSSRQPARKPSRRETEDDFAPLQRRKSSEYDIPRGRKSKKAPQSNSNLLIGGIAAGVLFFIVAGIGVFMMMGGDDAGASGKQFALGDQSSPTPVSNRNSSPEMSVASEEEESQPDSAPSSEKNTDDSAKSETASTAKPASDPSTQESSAPKQPNILRSESELKWNVNITAPAYDLRNSELFPGEFPVQNQIQTIYKCTTPSPYILLGEKPTYSAPSNCYLVNMETSEVLNEYTLPGGTPRFTCITPDGKSVMFVVDQDAVRSSARLSRAEQIAQNQARLKAEKSGQPFSRYEIYVHSLETGELIRKFEPLTGKRQITYTEFINSDKLILADQADRRGDPNEFEYFRRKGYQVQRMGFLQFM